MKEQEFGPLRSKASRKPWPERLDIAVYRCIYCANLYQQLNGEGVSIAPNCCDAPMERLTAQALEDAPSSIYVDYKIVGGFNKNAVQVFWKTEQPEDKPDWILLKTFTGSYLKYMTEGKQPPMTFPLSDEDAYVYCGREVCKQCVFRCKKGFILYVYIKAKGLWGIPLDKMTDYFKRK